MCNRQNGGRHYNIILWQSQINNRIVNTDHSKSKQQDKL